MKTILIRIWLLFVLSWFFYHAKADYTLTHTINYSIGNLHTQVDSIGEEAFILLNYDQIGNIYQPGHPALPCQYISFSVPYNAVNISVAAIASNVQDITTSKRISPAQKPVSLSDTVLCCTLPDSLIYNSSIFYPSTQARVCNESFIEGENHVITVAVVPITYNPVQNKLKLYKKMKIQLHYELADSVPGYTCIVRSDQTLRTQGHQLVSNQVVNPTQVEIFAPPANAPVYMSPSILDSVPGNNSSMNEIDIIPHYEYMIISTQELKPALRRILALKRQKGMTAGVVTLDEIANTPLPGLANNHEISPFLIREYLRYAYSRGTRYVLLAGDIPYKVQPMFNSYYQVPTDWYYSELSNDWINTFSANSESMDFGPELFVGRLMCKEQAEINNNTDKLFRYALNPGNGNTSYLQRALFMVGLDLMGPRNNILVPRSFSTILPDTVFIREQANMQYPKGSDVINTINSTHFGLLSFHNHGMPTGITTYGIKNSHYYDSNIPDKAYRIWAVDTVMISNHQSSIIQDSNSGLNNLTNRLYPSIAYSIACDVMPFDTLGIFNVKWNFGQSFTLGKDFGGPVFLGNTRVGFVGPSAEIEIQFANLLSRGVYKIGEAEAWSKYYYKDNNYSNYVTIAHNLFGDPDLEMWTDIPLSYTGISEVRGNNYITVSGIQPQDTIAFSDNSGQSLYATSSTGGHTFTNISPNGTVMVYRHNYIPYIAPLFLQNQSIENDQYIIASSLSAGRLVDSNRTSGDFVIPSGRRFEVEYSNKVVLSSGFKVEKGAVFSANLSASTYKNR